MPGGSVRQAQPLVLVNGAAINGVMDVEIQSNNFFAADRFSARVALAANSDGVWVGPTLLVEIRIGVDGTWASLITGVADRVSIDPIKGEVRVWGRDLTAGFVAAQIEESFENQTSSEVATLLAARRGLLAAVTATDTLIGRYYQSGRTRTSLPQHARATTEWDLLCWLAQTENFDVWVGGQTLYFQPLEVAAPSFVLTPRDCVGLTMQHALDIAAGVTVTVRSWSSLSQSAIVQSSGNGVGTGGSNRTVIRPNLSSDDAQMLADRLVSQISGHERTLFIDVPGDVVTAPRMIMGLTQTGTDFDGQYVVCGVDRRLSFAHGFTQTIEARSLPWTPS